MAAAAAFSALRVPSNVLMRLAKLNIATPTPVQRAALPALMPRTPSEVALTPAARTAVIRWPTGSGKTLAYALPMLARLDMHALGGGLQGLVLAPTRELCLQTARTLRQLTGNRAANKKGHAIKVATLLGKRSVRMESELVHTPPDLVVGTPRLVASLLRAQKLRLCVEPASRTVVLDEVGALTADFRWPAVAETLGAACAPQSSLYLVSAEVPEGAVQRCVEAAAAGGGRRGGGGGRGGGISAAAPVLIEPADASRMPASLRHAMLPPDPAAADASHLSAIVREVVGPARGRGRGPRRDAAAEQPAEGPARPDGPASASASASTAAAAAATTTADPAALVFVGSAGDAYVVSDALRRHGLAPAGAIHGRDSEGWVSGKFGEAAAAVAAARRAPRGGRGEGRKARGRALEALATGRARVLVATEMLAHGVDVKGASHVVNAQTPADVASYMHRAGRVGRTGGGRGVVLSLPRDEVEAARLGSFAEELGFELEPIERAELPELAEWARRAADATGARREPSTAEARTVLPRVSELDELQSQ